MSGEGYHVIHGLIDNTLWGLEILLLFLLHFFLVLLFQWSFKKCEQFVQKGRWKVLWKIGSSVVDFQRVKGQKSHKKLQKFANIFCSLLGNFFFLAFLNNFRLGSKRHNMLMSVFEKLFKKGKQLHETFVQLFFGRIVTNFFLDTDQNLCRPFCVHVVAV